MADKHSKEVRSYNMSRVKNKNTLPEMFVRKKLHALGFRYRLHNKDLPGKPDIVLKKYNTAIFINGCFWHKCPKCNPSMPVSNAEFWKTKIDSNVQRDEMNIKRLKKEGWNVITVWECELKKNAEQVLHSIEKKIKSNLL
jgi:DNA mismatch endonuclease (patch repair protein)